jgi:hypothetical protein
MVEYRDVPGFPGYRVGEDGSVWSCWGNRIAWDSRGRRLDTRHHRLTPGLRSRYLAVALRKDGKSYTRAVHRLVLEAFAGPCPPNMEARHLDGNRTNNKRYNLLWGTRQENVADRLRHAARI